MSTFPNHWHANPPVLIDMAPCGQGVKILITLQPYGIFESHFAYLSVLISSSNPGMQNGGDGLPSIYFSGQGLLVKMLISLELHEYFNQILFAYLYILTLSKNQVCKKR